MSLRTHTNVNQYAAAYFTSNPERIASDSTIVDIVAELTYPDYATAWAATKSAALTANPSVVTGTYISSRLARADADLLFYPRECVPLSLFLESEYYAPAVGETGQFIDYTQFSAQTKLLDYISSEASSRDEAILYTDNWVHPDTGGPGYIDWSDTMDYMSQLKDDVNATGTDLYVNVAMAIGSTGISNTDIDLLALSCDGITLELALHENIATNSTWLANAVEDYTTLLDGGVVVIFIPVLFDAYTQEEYDAEARFLAGWAMILDGPLVSYPFFYGNPEWHLWPSTYGSPTGPIVQDGTTVSREFGNYTFVLDGLNRELSINFALSGDDRSLFFSNSFVNDLLKRTVEGNLSGNLGLKI